MSRWTGPVLIALAACAGEPPPALLDPADDVEIDLLPVGPDPADVEAAWAALPSRGAVVAQAPGGRTRVLSLQLMRGADGSPDGSGGAPTTAYVAHVYDYATDRTLEVVGDLRTPEALTVVPSSRRFPPTLDEVDAAVDLLLASDPELAARVDAGELELFRAMPPLLDDAAGHRVVPIGIRAPGDDPESAREILGADLSARSIRHYAGRTPPNARITGFACNPPPDAAQPGAGRGVQGWTRLVVRKAGREVWSMNVFRPAASAGADGSGVELTDVRFRGKPVLASASLPILNVQYDDDACGPYRDWQWQENPFSVGPTRKQLTPGIRLVEWAKTMRETRSDTGNFSGVAAFHDVTHGQYVVLSELSAGWYRYVTEWRFSEDGTIDARWGFDAVQNYCTCLVHTHHAYWRLDFGIGATGDRVELFSKATGGWSTLLTEQSFLRDDADDRRWRVRDPSGRRAYELLLGRGQDAADAYGIADVWVVAAHGTEVEDSVVGEGPLVSQAGLDAFLDGEPVDAVDNVVWAAGHFRHDDASASSNHTHTVSLRLKPVRP